MYSKYTNKERENIISTIKVKLIELRWLLRKNKKKEKNKSKINIFDILFNILAIF